MFQCDKLGSQCYSEKEHCNGIGHCSNKRDEQSCSEYDKSHILVKLCGQKFVAVRKRKAQLSRVLYITVVLCGHCRSNSVRAA